MVAITRAERLGCIIDYAYGSGTHSLRPVLICKACVFLHTFCFESVSPHGGQYFFVGEGARGRSSREKTAIHGSIMEVDAFFYYHNLARCVRGKLPL